MIRINNAKNVTTKTSNGTAYAVGAVVSGMQSVAGIGDGQTSVFRCSNEAFSGGTSWEFFVGQYTASNSRVTRTQFLSSSTGSPIAWATGSKHLSVSPSAEQQVVGTTDQINVADNETTGQRVASLATVVTDGLHTFEAIQDNLAGAFVGHRRIAIAYDDTANEFDWYGIEQLVTLTSGVTITADLNVGSHFDLILAHNAAVIKMANEGVNLGAGLVGGTMWELMVEQDATGNHSFTFDFDIEWVDVFNPALMLAPNRRMAFRFLVLSVSGPSGLPARCRGWIESDMLPKVIGDTAATGSASATITTIQVGGVVSGSNYPAGLIHHWTQNESSGNRLDSIGSANLVPTGLVSSVAGHIGNAATFGLNGREMTASGIAANSGAFGFAIWVKIGNGITSNRFVFRQVCSGGEYSVRASDGGGVGAAGGLLEVTFVGPSGLVTLATATAFNDGNWHLLVATISGAILKVSLDGSAFATTTAAGTLGGSAATDVFVVGNVDSIGSQQFNGTIDQLSMFAATLTTGDVATLWNGGAGLAYSGGSASNEIEELTITGNPGSGNVVATIVGQPVTIPFDATAGEVETLIEAALGAYMTVTGGPLPNTPVDWEFTGSPYAGTNVALSTVDSSGLNTTIVDWSLCDSDVIALAAGTGNYVLNFVRIVPGKTLHLTLDNAAGATGTLTIQGTGLTIDWRGVAAPSLPASGDTLELEFKAISATRIVAKVWG